MAVLYTNHFVQFFDNNGDPLNGGKLYAYEAGTTTPKDTYTTQSGGVANANPVPLDSSGRAVVFINGSYKFRLEDSAGNLVKETDNVTAFNTSTTTLNSLLPSQTGNSGKALITDGVDASWGYSGPSRANFTNKVMYGLTLSNNGSDATNDIDIAAGACVSDDGTTTIEVSALTKRLDASWAVGTNQGGLDTGAIADTTYHVWAIHRPDTAVSDVLFSTSASSPTMPTNYTKKKCIGSIVRTGAAIKTFVQVGNEFYWKSPVVDVDDDNPGTSAVTRTLTLPVGVVLKARVSAGIYSGTTGAINGYLSALDATDLAVQAKNTSTLTGQSNFHGCDTGTAWNFNPVEVYTNTSAQIRSRLDTSGAADRIGIITNGWEDPRI